MKTKKVGITQRTQRADEIKQTRNVLIRQLARTFSYREIAQIIRIDKGGACRIVRHGANTKARRVIN